MRVASKASAHTEKPVQHYVWTLAIVQAVERVGTDISYGRLLDVSCPPFCPCITLILLSSCNHNMWSKKTCSLCKRLLW